jgi:hypothetical protein
MTPTLWITTSLLAALLTQPEARVIEQGVDDVSPIARSSRIAPKDLRLPSDFEKVYEITTPDGKTVYARIDKGIAAVFTRSDYTRSGEALIPPNTVFHIGTSEILSSHAAPAYTPTNATNRLDTSVPRNPYSTVSRAAPRNQPGSAPQAQQDAPAPESIPGPPSIITNEIYRRFRIAQLLQSAAEPA